MERGIYTLANDLVYDQLVALLNSIRINCSPDLPICVIPYDENIGLVSQEIARRKNVFLFEQPDAIKRWEDFIHRVHQLYKNYPYPGLHEKRHQGVNMHRKYCAFDGNYFDKFVFVESDVLVFQPFDPVFEKLETYNFVVHDFQRLTSLRRRNVQDYFTVFKTHYKTEEELSRRFHCGGFWGSKPGVINSHDLEDFLSALEQGDIQVFNNPWLGEQSILNYMTLKKDLSLYNFTLDQTSAYNTGSCVTSRHFSEKDHQLYDHGKKLTYLHYMGIKNERLRRLCWWQQKGIPKGDILLALADRLFQWQLRSIPYKEIFLHYRFIQH